MSAVEAVSVTAAAPRQTTLTLPRLVSNLCHLGWTDLCKSWHCTTTSTKNSDSLVVKFQGDWRIQNDRELDGKRHLLLDPRGCRRARIYPALPPQKDGRPASANDDIATLLVPSPRYNYRWRYRINPDTRGIESWWEVVDFGIYPERILWPMDEQERFICQSHTESQFTEAFTSLRTLLLKEAVVYLNQNYRLWRNPLAYWES